MRRALISLLIATGLALSTAACGVKSDPKYVPDTQKAQQKNS